VDTLEHGDWARYVLLLGQEAAYSGTASIQIRLGAPSSAGTAERSCQMNFDDFMWEASW